ncbi:hypothetical protein D9757_008212 [Collybiopsis confluens]|uniref:SWI/SNF and RSC complexes subunit Ssr4 N-terminal domain-containing protein n=1 Tax=Collybiopsis confluens TaxID=2823264 RepID=A0A8H5HBJ6_9AGAR|nr:hypothetical protein D9757_008212 [Collybiopsis confluens]
MPSSTLVEIQQLQAEGLVLRYPEILNNPQLSLDGAVSLLMRAAQQAQQVPFIWSWLDRAQDGQTFVMFHIQSGFPNDGIRWQEPESKFTIGQGTPKEMEVGEVKFGFIPGSGEATASRIRRRYRLLHGGLQQLWIVHYTRGTGPPVPPAVANQPVRMYPLRQVNEPGMFVTGEKLGQKSFPPGMGPMGGGMPGGGMPNPGMANPGMPNPGMPNMGSMGGNMGMGGPMGGYNQQHPQAMIAQQNSNMEMLEARNRARGPPPSQGRGPPPGARPRGPMDDDDSGDENDSVSTRALALTRYKRNHDLMNEVFIHAAYRHTIPPQNSPYLNFDKKEVDDKVAKLTEEIEALKSRAEERKLERERRKQAEQAELALLEAQPQPLPESISFPDSRDALANIAGVELGFAGDLPDLDMDLGIGTDIGGGMGGIDGIPAW